ncbi:MAG: T9SS type A sorting domain-containing protein [bacterium]|nr:T9SS type A sorting domain-containing protein [bacterium]
MFFAFRLFLPVLLLLISTTTFAQWPDESAVNLPLGTGDGDQIVPHLAINPDGSCYVGWYDNSSSNYNVNLQLLAADGTEQWPHGGITVSGHAQNSWVMDWSLIADSGGNAIVSFADIRGGNSNIHVYKIASDGSFSWGADGIDVSNNADSKGPPSLVETNNGDVVVAWFQDSTFGGPSIKVQRYNSEGTPLLAAGGLSVTEGTDSLPSGQSMVPCGTDGFLMAYVPVYSFMGNRQIKAQRFDASAQPVWADYLMIMDDATVPMGHYFQMIADGQGGAFFSWSVATGLNFTARAQHVDQDGNEDYGHNGLPVSTNPGYSQISPDLTFNPTSGEATVFYIQMSSNQNEKGVFSQRISTTGERLWTDNGVQIVPVDTTIEGFVRAEDSGDAVMGLFFQAPYNSFGQDQVVGIKVDTDGSPMWIPAAVGVSTNLSGKDDLMTVIGEDGTVRAIWADNRSGNYDIYGQNLNGDGTLGSSLSPAPLTPMAGLQLNQNHPNPFNPATDIKFETSRRQHVVLRIYDVQGRLVRTLYDGDAGPGSESVHWNGRDDHGAETPSGVYYYQLSSGSGTEGRKMVLVR